MSDLLSASMTLVGKLKLIHASSAYQSVWECAQNHQGPYKGPQYDKELAALEAAIVEEHKKLFPEEFTEP
jgi:hypothetical protein